ncbi:hypothetical protein BC938DRAFT_480960 [Jimgerdemannia flammicorona]|uniref:Uncharacterized protein n=1 Tax=Jimgerdemannia flammicorona TaxID=994334 RepID=A0A433QH95_9FUNG|nr:hypothetical protein BC938DRAFT_480960 [Jimgerdemannia flammicorona]
MIQWLAWRIENIVLLVWSIASFVLHVLVSAECRNNTWHAAGFGPPKFLWSKDSIFNRLLPRQCLVPRTIEVVLDRLRKTRVELASIAIMDFNTIASWRQNKGCVGCGYFGVMGSNATNRYSN